MRKLLLVAAVLLPCFFAYGQNLVILHTNDTHSHIEPVRSGKDAGLGGVVERAVFVDSVRNAAGEGNVLLVDAGDFSQGSSYFTLMNGDIEIDVMNAMRYDVACLGNHEFDNGLEELARRVRNADFPVLCSNYDFSQCVLDGVVKPYTILYRGGLKIGFIGLLTDLTVVVDREIADRIRYLDPAEVTNRYAKYLKEERSCDMVICLSHLGIEKEVYTDRVLVPQIENVDMVIGGHSHTFLEKPEYITDRTGREIPVVTDGLWGLNIGQADIYTENLQKEHLIASEYDRLDADTLFTTGGEWFPYPDYEDREAWNALFGEYGGRIISMAEKNLGYKWENIPATAYLEYERTGERTVMEKPYDRNRKALALFMMAELAEGEGRFMDDIVNGLWFSASMPSWVLSAHNPRQHSGRSLPDPREQIIDLGSGGYGALMAIAYHFFSDEMAEIDPSINYCVEQAVKEKILDPYFDLSVRKANWWMAEGIAPGVVVNNWNPWCNSNVILCFLLMEKDHDRLARAMRMSAESVDRFIGFIKSDGACEEGPSYWGHAAGKLYDYLQIIYDASGGKLSFFDNETVKRMGEYISRSYIGDDYVVNFADATAVLSPDFPLVYRFGKATGSDEMKDFALYLMLRAPKNRMPLTVGHDAYRFLESVRYCGEMTHAADSLRQLASRYGLPEVLRSLRSGVPANTWYEETQFCYLRNDSGWFFAAKGGHNNESHNHNDVGTFILYADNRPVFVDAGVGTYTKKTFSYERYTIWSMQSDWHNLPMINGASQIAGPEFRAENVSCNPDRMTFSADISGAYGPNASCRSWTRSYSLGKNSLKITDAFSLDKRIAADTVNFMVVGEVRLPGEDYTDADGSMHTVGKGTVAVLTEAGVFSLKYPSSLEPSVEVRKLDDPRLSNVWGDSLRRISFVSKKNAPVKGIYTFFLRQLSIPPER